MKPELYIKSANGKYIPYNEPKNEVSDTLYRKVNGKYIPVGAFVPKDYLPEGVWIHYRNCWCNGYYTAEKFNLLKVGDLFYPALTELSGILDATCYAVEELSRKELQTKEPMFMFDKYEFVVLKAVEYLKRKQDGSSNKK